MTLLRRHWRLVAVLLLAAAAFARAATLPFSILDDLTYVVNNPLVAHPLSDGAWGLLRTPAMGYPHTVTVLSFALERRLVGVSPATAHVVNLALHLANVALVYRLLLALRVPVALAGKAIVLFAVHPLVVEPVCWAIGRKDLLATGLFVAACVILVNHEHEPRPRRWAAIHALCIASLLAKPSALGAPLLLWLIARCARPAWSRRRLAVALTPLALVAAAVALSSLFGVRAQGAVVARTPWAALVDAARAIALQLGHLVWPRGLVAEYYPTAGDPPAWSIALALAVTVAIAIAILRTNPRGSVERLALAFAAIAWLPVSGVVPTSHFTADSYLYLPLVGLTLTLATAAPRVWRDLDGLELLAPALALACALQSASWTSARATYESIVARYPNEPRPLNRLAFAFFDEKNDAAAARTFIDLDERFPEFPFNRAQRAWAWAFAGDTARSEAVYIRCVRDGDAECAARLWEDLARGRRRPESCSNALLADTYRASADLLARRFSSGWLRQVATLLRARGAEELARRAEADAAHSR